jgi:ubiquinone/menaquinone biosynthesis C-methylase UbiE
LIPFLNIPNYKSIYLKYLLKPKFQFMLHKNIIDQNHQFDQIYKNVNQSKFNFHFTDNILIRYLRDRRLQLALNYLYKFYSINELKSFKVLIVCGGVGGEGVFFYKAGFSNVTNSDFSSNSLSICNALAPELKTIILNAESLELNDGEYDIAIVQDGLHHLTRPALGLTEMLRVSTKAIIVIEPYNSFIGNFLGTEWEKQDEAINFVYRWDKYMINQTVKSYLLKNYKKIKVFRIWDHNLIIGRIIKYFPTRLKIICAKLIYSLLSLFNFSGNMMVSIILK